MAHYVWRLSLILSLTTDGLSMEIDAKLRLSPVYCFCTCYELLLEQNFIRVNYYHHRLVNYAICTIK